MTKEFEIRDFMPDFDELNDVVRKLAVDAMINRTSSRAMTRQTMLYCRSVAKRK